MVPHLYHTQSSSIQELLDSPFDVRASSSRYRIRNLVSLSANNVRLEKSKLTEERKTIGYNSGVCASHRHLQRMEPQKGSISEVGKDASVTCNGSKNRKYLCHLSWLSNLHSSVQVVQPGYDMLAEEKWDGSRPSHWPRRRQLKTAWMLKCYVERRNGLSIDR